MMKKKITIIAMCVILLFSLTACGEGTYDNQTQTTTDDTDISDDLSLSGTPSSLFSNGADRQLWFYCVFSKLTKESTPNLYVFEDGMVTIYTNYTVTLMDMVDKSDDEIISMYAESHDVAMTGYAPEPIEFSLSIKTDDTGNYTAEERLTPTIDGKEVRIDEVTTTSYEFGSNEYAGFVGGSSTRWCFLTRVDGAYSLSLDQPGTDGVEVD